jgi:hypothetical protein
MKVHVGEKAMLMPNVTIANVNKYCQKDGGLSLKVFHYLNH